MRSVTRYRTAQFSSKIACHRSECLGCRFLFLTVYSIYFFRTKTRHSGYYFYNLTEIPPEIPEKIQETANSEILVLSEELFPPPELEFFEILNGIKKSFARKILNSAFSIENEYSALQFIEINPAKFKKSIFLESFPAEPLKNKLRLYFQFAL